MKRIVMLLLCCVMLLSSLSAAFAERDEALDQAFASGESLKLSKASLPAIALLYGWMPISQAPDGETTLWGDAGGSLYLIRGGLITPVKPAPERGAGDPYEKLEKTAANLSRTMPGKEGVVWSPDGRYAIATNKEMALQQLRGSELLMLDAQTGELFFAASYNSKFTSDDMGMIFEAKFDASGRYVYFSGRVNALSEAYALFRCDVETFEVELVNENLIPTLAPSLFQAQDGTWMMMCTQDNRSSTPETLYQCPAEPAEETALAMYRMLRLSTPLLGQTGKAYFRPLPVGLLRTERMDYSAASGYGLMLAMSQTNYTTAIDADTQQAIPWRAFQLSRITPDGPEMDQYWYLLDESPDFTGVQLLRVEDEMVQMLQTAAKASDMSVLQADPEKGEAFGAFARKILQSRTLLATAFTISPDGYYALINAGVNNEYRFFLLNLETMEIRPVDAPEGLASASIGTQLGQRFRPGMVWNADGSLLIYNAEARTVEAYRLELP